MYLAGDHYAIVTNGSGAQSGVDSFLALELPQISSYMAQYGYLPYVATPPTATWNGGTSTSWGTGANWSTGVVPVGFDRRIKSHDLRIGALRRLGHR